jgi:hypothetical protein
MFWRFLALAVVCFIHPGAWASGFSKGNDRSSISLTGDLRVICPGQGAQYVRCEADYLSGGEFDYFQSSLGLKADKVVLSNVADTGHRAEKSMRFDSKNQTTTSRVNLWSLTVFQRPLLDLGKNRVTATYFKAEKPIGGEQVIVQVERAAPRWCRPDTLWVEHCDGIVDSFCDEYFHQQDYCQ